jgi:hypothetical protein
MVMANLSSGSIVAPLARLGNPRPLLRRRIRRTFDDSTRGTLLDFQGWQGLERGFDAMPHDRPLE